MKSFDISTVHRDISWVLFELKEVHKTLNLIYQANESNLTYIDFHKIDKLLGATTDRIEYIIGGKKVLAVHDNNKKYDLLVSYLSPMFKEYLRYKERINYKEFFHRNLNPDTSTFGFLEQLAYLLKIANERPLLIYFDITNPKELEYFKVIKEYIESQ